MTTAPAIPPPLVALAAGLVQRAVSPHAARPGAVRRSAALALAAASAGVSLAAATRFRQSGTTIDPHHPDRASALVTSGVYGLTRNPMYLGLAGLLTAHAVRRGSVAALLPVAGFVAWIDRLQIPPEEAALAARFGEEYDTFRAEVPRWLGR